MHPIERLRSVARAGSVGQLDLVREAATALGGLGDDGAGLVLSCKRLVARQPTSGLLWWLCSRLLRASDPRIEAWRCLDEVEADPTARHLADELPDDARVTVLGWPEVVADALPRRGDLEVLVVDTGGDGVAFARRLRRADVDALDVPEAGTGAAVAGSDVLVLDAVAFGRGAALVPTGSLAAAAVARHASVPTWAVVGVGRALPPALWDAVLARLDDDGDPWDRTVEVVPPPLLTSVVGPSGVGPAEAAGARADAGVAPELLEREG